MLRFDATNAAGAAPGSVNSDMQHLLSVCDIPDVAAGLARAVVSASFNRVAGDAETDRLFGLRLRAYSGLPSSYDATGELAGSEVTLLSDSDPATWESAATSLDLPADTSFLAIWLYASEDVFNDGVAPEFDGHYADEVVLTVQSALSPAPSPMPATLKLEQSQPNPFNPSTTIRFTLPSRQHVQLAIHNPRGHVVRTLLDEVRDLGPHAIDWDGKDSGGRSAASGVYFYRVTAAGFMETRKMVLLK